MTNADDRSRAAATVVIVRDDPGGPPEILMMERSSRMAFAPGALVFPGGGVDARDLLLAERIDHGLDPHEAASRIAAIRETIEESGLGIGLTGRLDDGVLAAIRSGLNSGASLAQLLDVHGLGLALDAIVPFARWHPAVEDRAIRIYDTRFYLARAPQGQEAIADATENVHLFWASAAETLARCDAGQGHIIYPTRRNLERLALFASHADMVDHAMGHPVEKVRPWVEERDGQRHLCIPTHLGYPVTSELLVRARRG